MPIFTVIFWMIIVHWLVLLADDVSCTVRGRQSPRMKARQQRREAAARGKRPRTAVGRTRRAVGDYFAGLTEDAAIAAQESRRRRRARRHARNGEGPVLIDFDQHAGHWYGTCDLCGWTSRPHRVEDHARDEAADHVHSEHEEDDPQPEPVPAPPQPIEAGAPRPDPTTEPAPPDQEDATEPATGWTPRVIPGGQQTDQKPGGTVNLEATGPEEIRNAFAAAIEAAHQKAEEIDGVAAVLTEAADRYESLSMAGSTVEQIREAADQFAAAQAALADAAEHLEGALADFNARDGVVGDAVTDVGNLADAEVVQGA